MKLFRSNKKKTQGNEIGADFRICLEHAGTPLYELHTGEYTKEIVIGRSASCTWSLDGVDNSTSSKHAVISRRKNSFYVTDLGSRNGIFYQNKRVKEKKLALGDRVSLGECTIVVDVPSKKMSTISRFHQVEYTNEKGKKTIVDIVKPQTVIGSHKDCDIIFQDQLVSSRHTEIVLRSDGSCWIRDLNSRNGTSVNGTELPPDGERMLQDNDVITIAYLDLRFLDASVEHYNSKVWTTVITLAVTVLVIMGGYIGYMKLTPNSNEILRMANEAVKRGDFDGAKKLIAESAYAENADNARYEREQLSRKIANWESVMQMWESVKADLNARNYNVATQKLSSINHDDLNAWTWPGGGVEKRRAMAAKRLLDACSASSAVLRNEIASVGDVENYRRELALAITEAEQYEDDYFVKAVADAKPLQKRIDKTLNEDKELQATLALLNIAKPDYQAVLRRLEKISKESAGPVKARADKVIPAVQTLNRETLRVLAMVDKVCEMDFPTVHDFKLDLPDGIDYSSEKNIGSLRRLLIDTVVRFKDTALQLSLIHKTLVDQGVVVGQTLPVLDTFMEPEKMKQVYAFDCLDMPLPKMSRQTPAGKYDELLGIEFFYDYVSNIHSRTMTLNMEELPFKPTIYSAKSVIVETEKFIRFADKDENQWFNHGQFAEYLAHCRKILAMRDRIVEEQLALEYAPGGRQFMVSRGIAAYLSPESDKTSELCSLLEKSFSIFKQEILKLNREYNIAMPEEALKIRGQIIDIGLPGDPILKKMWQQRPEGGWVK